VSAATAAVPDPFEHNGLLVHVATRTVTVDGSPIALTRTEFELLPALLEGGRVVRGRSCLARRLRPGKYDACAFVSEADERAVEAHIGNLRRKLGDLPRTPRWVETVRGVGYRMTPAQTADARARA